MNTDRGREFYDITKVKEPSREYGQRTTESSAAISGKLSNKNIARTTVRRNLSDKTSQHSLDLLTEVNEGIADEQKRKAEKVAETMDYGNPRAMKLRAGEESYLRLPGRRHKKQRHLLTCQTVQV